MYQKELADPFSELIRRLYSNEFMDNTAIGETGEPSNGGVDVQSISAQFPPPASLNMINTLEQMNNFKDIIGFVVDMYLQNEDNQKIKDEFTLAVAKDIISSVDWPKYDEILKKVKIDLKQKENLPADDEESEPEGGNDNSFGGQSEEEPSEEEPSEEEPTKEGSSNKEPEEGSSPPELPKLPGM